MTEYEYFFLKGRLEPYNDFSDGAWWAACESACGGYDRFMAWLQAGRKYEPETIVDIKERK